MLNQHRFDSEKTLETLVYIALRCNNMYNLLKVLYFADKLHLEKYGRQISGDSYVAMSHGPVPSGMYAMIKFVRDDGFMASKLPLQESFAVKGYMVIPLRAPDTTLLSESDLECLDEAIEKYGKLSFSKLKALSHDAAYKSADENDFISLDSLAHSLPDGEKIIEELMAE